MSDLKRWNFEDGGEGVVLCCKDHHEKGAPCEYEPLTAQDAARLTGCIARQDVEITLLQVENEALKAEVVELVDALELISDTDPDEGTAWFHEIADKALAAHRKQESKP